MHVLSSSSAFLVNAEVDSMGGVIDGGAGVDSKTSRRASIEKARAELRQEFDVREERRRELEFLEKGGNPLDFKLGPATSISVQSTSVTDQHTEHEAKDSFALTPSPHGDSVNSSVRPLGREPTTADNLLLFDGVKDMLHGDGNATYPSRRGHIASSEEFFRPGRSHKGKESEDSAMFRVGVRSQAYARRNRSRSSHDSAHACSTNLVPSSHSNRSSILPSSCHNSRNVKGSLGETHLDKGHTISSIRNSKTASPNANVVSKTTVSNNKMDMELGAEQGRDAVEQKKTGLSGVAEIKEGRHTQLSQMAVEQDHKALSTRSVGGGEQELEESMPCVAPENEGNFITAGQLNGISSNVDENDLKNKGQNTRNCFSATVATGGLDSDLSCKKISHSLDENIASNEFLISKKVNGSSIENAKEQKTVFEVIPPMPDPDFVEETESRCVDVQATASDALPSVRKNTSVSDAEVKIEEIFYGRSDLQNEAEPVTSVVGAQLIQLGDATNSKKTSVCSEARLPCTSVSFNSERLEAISPVKGSAAAATTELQSGTGNHLQLAKEHEDAILERARTIEASRKRISQLSLGDSHSVKRRKCHWDFVLEEMAWLSNDFMQERIWKITAAAHMSHCAAFSGRTKFSVETLHGKQKEVAYTLAKAIMQFWHSFDEVLQDRENPSSELHDHSSALFVFGKANGVESVKDTEEPIVSQETSKDIDGNISKQNLRLPIQRYALRFLRYIKSSDCSVQAQAPMTPDRKSNAQILQSSCEDPYSEKNLFYAVPFGAMEEYRNSVSSHWAQNERTGNIMFQDEVETSLFDSVAEFGSRENVDEEDEGAAGIYYLPRVFKGTNPSKYVQRTKKSWQKSNGSSSYELGSHLPYGHCQESKPGSHSLLLPVKRPSINLHLGSIPTKRVRTAKRQRAVSPFGVGIAGGGQLENKTEASSGDTTSFYEDQTSVHGSQTRKISEVESTGDFVKQLRFDTAGKSTKPKKKKAKHLGFRNTLNSNDSAGFMGSVKGSGTFEQGWQLDSMAQHEQNDNLRKRLESQSNGNTGMYGHPGAKKPRASKQLPNASLETMTPMSGSIPSPVASQMNNMSNSNKLIKVIAGRDRDRKAKALKMSAGQSAFGNPWSVYEDQALVVLVHDMGPNWELVSDAINSTLQFKCIFRKPKECKEHHKELMDRNTGDGADSAEDSGSSQHYPSTLPGIPKGSARQLLQHLQGPMEEDTLKDHFEKIIRLGQQLHTRRSQNDIQEVKQFTTAHSSHTLALSDVCPNNSNGGFLTPLDLCEASTSSPDVLSPGYQGPHFSGLAVTNHKGSVASVLPAPGTNPMLQVSSGMVLGNGLPSPSSTLNGPVRDMQRYTMSRPSSLPVDEQQRMQHSSQMLPSRNIKHSSVAVSGALPTGNDHGVHMPSGANGLGMMCGMKRGMAMPRPAFQGIVSPSMINMVPPANGVGMASPVNIHNCSVSGQGNPIMRPCEALQMLQPGQSPEDQRQKIQELQMQVTHRNGPGNISYNGSSAAFPNQTGPPVQAFPVQHQQQQQMPHQSHVLSNLHQPRLQGTNTSTHQQTYVIRVPKQRHQLQQQRLLQQQQQFTAPNSSPPQHPISAVPSNNSQIQQSSTQSVPVPLPPVNLQHPLTTSSVNTATLQAQQKQHHVPQGLSRSPQTGGAVPNQMLKQRQLQQLQQPRHCLQQLQQSRQQGKFMKGIGKGSMMLNQNLPIDAPQVNGLSPPSGIHVPEKGEQPVMHLMQGQGLFPGSGQNPVPSTKQLEPQTSNQVQQQKMLSRPLQPSQKQQSRTLPHLDNNNQGQMQIPPSHAFSASQQPVLTSPLAMASQQPQQPHRQTSQQQEAVQRAVQKNCQTCSDAPMQSLGDQAEANSQLMNNTFQTGACTIPQCTALNNVPGNPHQSNSDGTEPMSSSSQRLVNQGQFSGSIQIHGQIGGQWQQQQLHQLPQQQPQQQLQGQMQCGSLHAQCTVSGPV